MSPIFTGTVARVETVEGTLQTPDGQWRVEIVRRGRTRWYRIVHGEDVIDWLSIAAVERILDEAGVDMAQLVEVGSEPEEGVDESGDGAA
jgi:bifunctional non-homologous end joining protein LigD